MRLDNHVLKQSFQFKKLALSILCVSTFSLTACNNDQTQDATQTSEPTEKGAWSTGDLHVHTIQSNDAQVKLEDILDLALNKNKLDWVLLSNHLRMESRDHQGNSLANGDIPFSQGIKDYEVPFVEKMLKDGKYPNKTVYSSFEWDMPTHDHVNIGLAINQMNNSSNNLMQWLKSTAGMFIKPKLPPMAVP